VVAKHHFQHYLDRVPRQQHRRLERRSNRLTIEEAAMYLTSIINLGPSPTVGNFNNSLIEDAREDSTLVTHGSPWTPVTRNYPKHAKVKPGRPTVEGGRADRNWRIEPGMYNARLYRSGSTPTTKQTKKKSKKDKKKSSHYKNYVFGHRQDGAPTYWIKDLNKPKNKEFQKALTYWMDHLKLIGHPTTLTAYDEGCYPNPDNKPSGRRPKKVTMSQRKQIPIKEPHRHVCYTTREHHSPSFMGRFLRPTTNTAPQATPQADEQ
jgi:hypothetical protein